MGFHFFSTLSGNRIPVACLLACLVSFAGCASTEEIGMIQWDINHLRSDIKELKQSRPSSYQKNEVDRKLNAIEERQKATAGTVSDLLIQTQSMTSEFQMLTGKFEEVKFFSEKSLSELTENKDILTAKVKELEGAVEDLHKQISDIKTALAAVEEDQKKADDRRRTAKAENGNTSKKPAGSAQKQQKTSGAAATSTRTKIKDIYMAGYQALREGKTAQAREKFSSILKSYPKSEYSDNARFWIGESYFKDENYPDAILSYEDLFKNNPDSDKVPGAMLKQGLAFYAIKDVKTGNIILEKLIEKYPDSEPAKLARKKMDKPSLPQKKK
jgi:tol-pal system protein YbgF